MATSSTALERLCLHSGFFSPRGPVIAVLTNGVTAFVSIEQSHDRAQGRVWVALDALQLSDGVVDTVCGKRTEFCSGTPDKTTQIPNSHCLSPHAESGNSCCERSSRACISWRVKFSEGCWHRGPGRQGEVCVCRVWRSEDEYRQFSLGTFYLVCLLMHLLFYVCVQARRGRKSHRS